MTTKREIMAGVESTSSKLVANNTVEYRRANGDRVIRLHLTDIVTFKASGDTVLDSGGYRTQTTKARMNANIGRLNLYQEKGQWYVFKHAYPWLAEEGDSEPVTFFDGMILPGGGMPRKTKASVRAERATAKLQDRINRFVKQVDKLDAMPIPNSGDCWGCLMFEKGQQGEFTNEAGGRIAHPGYRVNDASHLRSHITVKENYLHGTLIQNAYLWAGASMFMVQMHQQRWDQWAKDSTKRYLRRYLKAQLGIATN